LVWPCGVGVTMNVTLETASPAKRNCAGPDVDSDDDQKNCKKTNEAMIRKIHAGIHFFEVVDDHAYCPLILEA